MVVRTPNMDAEICAMKDRKRFASIEFVSEYWQLPMAEEAQPLHAFITKNSVVDPTCTIQGERNCREKFQGKV